jgi:hypothetical protein
MNKIQHIIQQQFYALQKLNLNVQQILVFSTEVSLNDITGGDKIGVEILLEYPLLAYKK